ncbi:MAG: hypothetical protein JXR46_06270 [Calditrichaceae bacterium]|nr:hypothetical protein [Calditrichaceae bacterium]MBN2708632.1 hypothetical protein [Calditrichaceae bacterium]RQV95481.1 MAG: hypothetical protein EH224_07630 [Calditrichota bacterium]
MKHEIIIKLNALVEYVMIRKAINILVLMVFLVSTTGYSVALHYCGDTLVSAAIGSEAGSCCEDDSGSCCQNEIKFYQLNEDCIFNVQNISEETKPVAENTCSTGIVLHSNTEDLTSQTVNSIAESPPPKTIQTSLSILQTYLL